MNNRVWLIFLSSIISFHISVDAVFGEHTFMNVREKIEYTYLLMCKKTSILYAKAKKHKKLIAGVVVYCAVELALKWFDRHTLFDRIFFLPTYCQQLNNQVQNLQDRIRNKEQLKQSIQEDMQNSIKGLPELQEIHRRANSERKEILIKKAQDLYAKIQISLGEQDTLEIQKFFDEYIEQITGS